MPFLYFGFVLMMVAWLFWAIAWVVVWAIVMLAWPVALVLAGAAVLRAIFRRRRHARGRAPAFAHMRRDEKETAPNSAFDDYREQTLRRLDEEREKFREFLEERRRSKDKEAFDRFVADRRARLS